MQFVRTSATAGGDIASLCIIFILDTSKQNIDIFAIFRFKGLCQRDIQGIFIRLSFNNYHDYLATGFDGFISSLRHYESPPFEERR